jgi:small subunit ribosomal protein S17
MDIAENVEQEISENTENIEAVAEIPAKPGRNLRKERTGIVVSNKMDKTVVVKIEERVTHSKYSKIMKRSIKFKAHDEKNECDIGDKVLIMETRPLSKDKHFRLVKILEKVK